MQGERKLAQDQIDPSLSKRRGTLALTLSYPLQEAPFGIDIADIMLLKSLSSSCNFYF